MDRITEKQLEAIVLRINKLTDSPLAPYTNIAQRLTPNAGNYHLDFTYGKVGLVRMLGSSGVESIIPLSTKRELYGKLHAFIQGFEHRNEGA